MQFTAGLMTEIINSALLCNITLMTDYIVLFVALLIIADIDDIYARSLGNVKLKGIDDRFPPVMHTHKELT